MLASALTSVAMTPIQFHHNESAVKLFKFPNPRPKTAITSCQKTKKKSKKRTHTHTHTSERNGDIAGDGKEILATLHLEYGIFILRGIFSVSLSLCLSVSLSVSHLK